jgi:plasmid stabilization system protein ParE
VKPVILRPAAEADLADANGWYDRQRAGLGAEFLRAATHAANAISELPESYQILYRGVRRAPIRRFPFGLLYRVYPDCVVVIACFHGSRNPRVWRRRLKLGDG